MCQLTAPGGEGGGGVGVLDNRRRGVVDQEGGGGGGGGRRSTGIYFYFEKVGQYIGNQCVVINNTSINIYVDQSCSKIKNTIDWSI